METRIPDAKSGSPFHEVKDPLLIAKIFDHATEKRVPVTLWLKNQVIKFEARPTSDVRIYKTFMVKYPKDFMVGLLADALAAQASDEILGSMPVDSETYFFRSSCAIQERSRALHIALPSSLFKIHRRAGQRVPFPRGKAPTLTAFDPTKSQDASKPIAKGDLLAFRMLDISVGGCALAAKIEDEPKLAEGTILSDVRFLLGGVEIVVEAAVKHVVKATNERGSPMLRVGLQFLQGAADFKLNISRYVADESRKLFTIL